MRQHAEHGVLVRAHGSSEVKRREHPAQPLLAEPALKTHRPALIKMADWALSHEGNDHTFQGADGDMLDNLQGTPEYFAPEMINQLRYDAKPADVWAAGKVCHKLLAACPPFTAASMRSPAAESLLSKLTEPDVARRATATDGVRLAEHAMHNKTGVPPPTVATPLRQGGLAGFTPAAHPSTRASRRGQPSRQQHDLMLFTPIEQAGEE